MLLEHLSSLPVFSGVRVTRDENGCLKIDYYHTQDWCDLSTVNLCKGHILQGYIQKRKQEGNQFDFIL
jgi:hypothetical protein